MKRPDQIKVPPDTDANNRVPPGQFLTKKFPVLTYGRTPKIDIESWRLRVFGLVGTELELDWAHFSSLVGVTITADFHCVTQWSALDQTWEGVPVATVISLAQPGPDAQFIMVHCFGGLFRQPAFGPGHGERAACPQTGWPALGGESRLALTAHRSQPLRLEKRQMGQWHRAHPRRRPRVLGTAGL